jgi:hypothetical protein
MVDDQHKKIDGYRDLTEAEIYYINRTKQAELDLGMLWRTINNILGVDKRWTSIAKTHFEEGFSALVRSIARPEERF